MKVISCINGSGSLDSLMEMAKEKCFEIDTAPIKCKSCGELEYINVNFLNKKRYNKLKEEYKRVLYLLSEQYRVNKEICKERNKYLKELKKIKGE